MSLYVIIDSTSRGNAEPRKKTGVDVMIYLDDVLPVFGSRELLWEFVRAWHSAQDPIRADALEVDVMELAAMAQHFAATEGIKSLVFDPKVGPSNRWILRTDPWSVSAYCRYILELARAIKRLRAEGRAKLRDEFPDSEELDKTVTIWIALQAEKVNADARALVAEWEIEDGS